MIADSKFDNEDDRRAIEALRRFNDSLARSGRFKATILPTGEGLTIGVKLR
jgi:caffeoyl-CoA O-methyltransferase